MVYDFLYYRIYENYILKLKEKGVLTENNLHLLENFNLKKTRFEK
jgi:hypothetical protein